MYKILVAPASYKGSISAHRLAAAIAHTCHSLMEEGAGHVVELPIADGGDDTLEALHKALGGHFIDKIVTGPVGLPVDASYLYIPARPAPSGDVDTAVVELARGSGIAYLKKEELSPLYAQTIGTGQLIDDAIARGAKKIIITIGGSASTDGGMGALSALGVRFLDSAGNIVPPGGGNLTKIADIVMADFLQRTKNIRFFVATDVTSPLLGADGAAAVFAPQKGADAAQVAVLDAGLGHFADCLDRALMSFEPAQKQLSLRFFPGAGAAGGAGYGFGAALNAEISSGFHFIAQLLDLEKHLDWCDLLIVAEGKLDRQSLTGKGVGEMIRMAFNRGKKVLAIPAISDLSAEDLLDFGSELLIHASAPVTDSGYKTATIADVEIATAGGLLQILQDRAES